MIRIPTFAGKSVAVFGLGGSGIATARALLVGGTSVAAWDDSEAGRNAAAAAGIPVVDLMAADWSGFAALVLAPGVPLTHPAPHWTVTKAHTAGIEIIGDVELFMRERQATIPSAPLIAITGTNGKSTTTALIRHLLAAQGHDVQMGGNIGVPVLALEPPAPNRIHVLELSSFQIDTTPTLNPTVGVMLNLSPDHLDRHGTMARYGAIKQRLVQGAEAACVGIDDPAAKAIADVISDAVGEAEPAKLYAFTTGGGTSVIPSLYAIGSSLFVHERGASYASSSHVASLDGIATLRGTHNVQNALASLTALRALQDRLTARHGAAAPVVWRPAEAQAALRSFPGLPHRMEQVGTLATPHGRVLFINDSKATNADSTEKALLAFPGDIYWIVGGKAKDGGIESLRPLFARVAKAYLIGASSDAFAATLDGDVALVACGSLDQAIAAATRDAQASAGVEPVVLLSPACASYDQFKSFEHRGNVFRDLVTAQLKPGSQQPSGPT
jgi:UDP-N-acetylmuramoylalanine--D-glutamate ligase